MSVSVHGQDWIFPVFTACSHSLTDSVLPYKIITKKYNGLPERVLLRGETDIAMFKDALKWTETLRVLSTLSINSINTVL